MITRNVPVVAIYKSHTEAEMAIKELHNSGFDLKRLSILGRDYYTAENVVSYYNGGNRMEHWGKTRVFWGGIWGLLLGSAFFVIPGFGPLLVAGPVGAGIAGVLEGAITVSGLSTIGAGLYSLGLPRDSALRFETALKTGQFVLIAHTSADEAVRARDIIQHTNPETLEDHQPAINNVQPNLVRM
jgi:hypothetical protein